MIYLNVDYKSNSKKASKRKYISSSEKAGFLIKKILNEGPLSVADLTEMFIKELNMRSSTARSSASSIVNELLEQDILEYVKTGKRGSKIVDISPMGFYVLFDALLDKAVKIITLDDLKNFLTRRGYGKLIPYIDLYLKIVKEEFEEEGGGDLLKYLIWGREFIDIDINTWDDLEEALIEKIEKAITHYYLEKKAGIIDLINTAKNLTTEEKQRL